jgi:PAP2 superfamily
MPPGVRSSFPWFALRFPPAVTDLRSWRPGFPRLRGRDSDPNFLFQRKLATREAICAAALDQQQRRTNVGKHPVGYLAHTTVVAARTNWVVVVSRSMPRAALAIRRYYSVEAELLIVALVLVAWHAVRIPLEGDVRVSLAHADDVLRVERALSLNLEGDVIRLTSSSNVSASLEWLYANIHLPVLFGFLTAARLLAPDRYPAVRTTFMASFVPAAFVIWLFPLAPPHWLPEFGLGVPPTNAELADTAGALFHNVTAAAASQHFGFAVFLSATSIWLFPRSWLAWTTLAYPVLAFLVVVGTGNHYVVDCLVGTLTFVVGALVAWLVHHPTRSTSKLPQPGVVVSVAVGYALVVWGFVSFELTMPSGRHSVSDLLALGAGALLVRAPRLSAKEVIAETN